METILVLLIAFTLVFWGTDSRNHEEHPNGAWIVLIWGIILDFLLSMQWVMFTLKPFDFVGKKLLELFYVVFFGTIGSGLMIYFSMYLHDVQRLRRMKRRLKKIQKIKKSLKEGD